MSLVVRPSSSAPLPGSPPSHSLRESSMGMSPAASFSLRCIVHFLYSNASLGDAPAPFAVPTIAVVEVVRTSSLSSPIGVASVPRSSWSGAHGAEGGLRIRPAVTLSCSSLNERVMTGTSEKAASSSPRRDSTRTHTKTGQSATPSRSVVRAVRRASRNGAGQTESRTYSSHTRSGSACAPQEDATCLSSWLPYSLFRSLEWSFRESPADTVWDTYEGGGSELLSRSSTLRGVAEGRSRVEVRLRCVDAAQTMHLPSSLEAVVLEDLSCTEALALADVFDEAQQTSRPRSEAAQRQTFNPSPVGALPAAHFADPISAGEPALPPTLSPTSARRASVSLTLQPPTESPNFALSAQDNYRHVASPLEPPAPNTLRRQAPTRAPASRVGALTKLPRSISFPDLTEEPRELAEVPRNHQQPSHHPGQPQQRLKPACEVTQHLTPGEAASYSRYARMLGIEPAPLRRSSSAPHSPLNGLPSSASFGDSFGSGLTSAVYTPLGGTLQFPCRDNAAPLSPTSVENAFVSTGDPLSEPPGLSQRRRAGGSGEDEDERLCSGRGELRLILPGVVETYNDAPTWFPTARVPSDVSEVTVSSTNCSVHRDGPAKVSAASAAAAAAGTTTYRHPGALVPCESPSCESANAHAISLSPREVDEAGGTSLSTSSLEAHAARSISENIVFPPLLPLPSSSAESSPRRPLPAPPPRRASPRQEGVVSAFPYLTAEQRRLVDFEQLLRPTIPPSSALHGDLATHEVASQPASSLTPSFPTAVDSDATTLRPPEVLDEILLKLRASSLPVVTASPPTPSRGANATSNKETAPLPAASHSMLSSAPSPSLELTPAPTTQTRTARPAVPSTEMTQAATAAVSAEPRGAPSPAPASGASTHPLVLSYREVLQQMRSRQVPAAPAASTSLTSPRSLAAATGKALPATLTLEQLQARRSATAESSAPVSATTPANDLLSLVPGSPLVRGDAVPHRAHGPFAQPAQHPPSTFLAHGSHRASTSPSPSPHRLRRLPPTSPHDPDATPNVQTNHPLHGGSIGEGREGNASPTSPPWRSARTRFGREGLSPQSPPPMLPRRPEPLIGTPKLALTQATGAGLTPSPITLGQSLMDEDGKTSSTSMAT